MLERRIRWDSDDVRWTVAALLAAVAATPAEAQTAQCPGGRFLLLTNGRIHTMDAQRSVVSRVRIANGRFVEVGPAASDAGGCTDTIDLQGRTVIPGMIDNHFHVQLVGSRPGMKRGPSRRRSRSRTRSR